MTRPSRKHFLSALGAAGAAPAIAGAAETYTMRYAIGEAPDSLFGLTGVHFASGCARRSNGQLKIEVYPNGQLASQSESIDMLVSGALDFTKQPSSLLVSLNPAFQVFDVPFLFKDLEAGYKVVDGPIGKSIAAGLESHGILALGWQIAGLKVLETTSKAVQTVDDMKGLRIRIQGGPVFVATYQALGALPVVVDITEVFTALQQHTIDGMDVTIDSFVSGKWYAVAKHVARTNYILNTAPIMGSRKRIESLPAPLQRIVKEEARAADLYSRTVLAQRSNEMVQLLKTNGVSFTDIQHAAFRKAVEPVYAMVQSRLGDLIERVTRATA